MTQSEYAAAAGLTRARVSQLVKAGMPLDSKEAADAWRGSGAKKRATQQAPATADVGPYRPPEAKEPIDQAAVTADTPQGAYERQKQIERAAFALAVNALKRGAMDAARLVSIHSQAARNLTAAREEVLKLSQTERVLVSGDWVRKVMSDHDGAVATLLRAMPKQLSGRIAPHDPEHAEAELERWVQEVALATLHNTDPWK